MKQLFTLGAALLCLLTACSDDDSQAAPPAGTYSLVTVGGGISGMETHYSRNDVIWDINAARDSVTITNNRDNLAGYPSGKYAYEVRSASSDVDFCNQTLYIDHELLGCYYTATDTIIVSNAHVDGLYFTFVKN